MIPVIPIIVRLGLMLASMGVFIGNAVVSNDSEDLEQQKTEHILAESYSCGLGQAI